MSKSPNSGPQGRHLSLRLLRASLVLCLSATLAACGSASGTTTTDSSTAADSADLIVESTTGTRPTDLMQHWNGVSIDASGLDHMHPAPGDPRKFGEQLGPHRASRAIAIVHIAMYDAVQSILGYYQTYSKLPRSPSSSNLSVAIAQAAHDTLIAMWPSQTATFDSYLAADLAKFPACNRKNNGIRAGQRAAAAILAARQNDGSNYTEPVVGVDITIPTGLGLWAVDPIVASGNHALGYYWGKVKPFALTSGSQFRLPPPPALTSKEYADAYAEAHSLGGDGVVTPTQRTDYQTKVGIFWAYDGTPSLCAPPRLYNQIAMEIAREQGTTHDISELSRYLAFLNTAMADAAIAAWDSKWFYNYWRPVTAMRVDDGNPDTVTDATFTPIGAPNSNQGGHNFTPPFPSYPSGHGTFGGALFEAIRIFYGTDDVSFTFESDEFNGVTKDSNGNVRPPWIRTFNNLSDPEEENGQSRIYLGIHWKFDKTSGITLGEQVADEVFLTRFAPRF